VRVDGFDYGWKGKVMDGVGVRAGEVREGVVEGDGGLMEGDWGCLGSKPKWCNYFQK